MPYVAWMVGAASAANAGVSLRRMLDRLTPMIAAKAAPTVYAAVDIDGVVVFDKSIGVAIDVVGEREGKGRGLC